MKVGSLIWGILFFILEVGNGQTKNSTNHPFILATSQSSPVIVVDNQEAEVVKIAAKDLSEDIKKITGRKPMVLSDPPNPKSGTTLLIGTVNNPHIQSYIQSNDLPNIQGKWEHFFIRLVPNQTDSSQKVLLIIGSDPRGAAYGVFTLSRKIGVSPWEWWADVTPDKKDTLFLNASIHIDQEPSVKYRGIFLNDEDWGLRPWASKTFEPQAGNIGPKTYAKIFELLLRLKANTIWPAMHPTGSGTTPFFEMKGNEKMAERYDIVVGTAHNEPMMTNIPVVWNKKKMGSFNYVTNKEAILHLWTKKIKKSRQGNNIYTLGMRGVGDSRMKGVSGIDEQVNLMSRIFKDQRHLIRKYINKEVTKVPQVFVPYKEVLPIYDHGLKVPEDVTLVWPDDNYGYIRRLSNANERKRSGSAGVYYHISYWGRPHDYLWLSSTQPGLIWEELKKAWRYGTKRLWMINVGDIKPAAYNIQFIMDLAWNIDSLKSDNLNAYMKQWHAQAFDAKNANKITSIMEEYYRLAAIRRPEFMGWSQTEPTTPTHNTAFQPFLDGDEIANRVRSYNHLIAEVNEVKKQIPKNKRNAFFELVAYPVKGAAYMNKKFLYAQKSRLYAQYHLPVANQYAALSRQAYDSIKILTNEYNHLLNGKWKGMMDMAPRNLPVFHAPQLPKEVTSKREGLLIWPEGLTQPDSTNQPLELPTFNPYSSKTHFIKLFNKGNQPIRWRASTTYPWIHLNKVSGKLDTEDQLIVSIDWAQVPQPIHDGKLVIHSGQHTYSVNVSLAPAIPAKLSEHPIVEDNGRVFMQASDFIEKRDYSKKHQWKPIQQLGYGKSAYTILPIPLENNDQGLGKAYLKYKFYTYSKGSAEITVYTLPTHPVNDAAGVRMTLSVDGGEKDTLSYKTEGRSETWKQNVLSNHAQSVLKYDFKSAGWHTLQINPLDPGVIIDHIMVNFKPGEKIYALPMK